MAGGLIALWDIGPALLLNGTCSLMAAGFLLVVARTSRPSRDVKTTILSDLAQGIQYFLGSPVALTVIGMGFALGFFSMPYIQVLPAFAKESLQVGVGGAGLLLSAAGIGSLVGPLILESMGNRGQKHWLLMTSAGTFSVSIFALAWSSWHWVTWVVLLVVGAGSMTYVSTTTTVLQLTVPNEMHGRMLSIWTLSAALIFIGALPMGVVAGPILHSLCMFGIMETHITASGNLRHCLYAGGWASF